ncbi:hypothetical protein FOA52_005995 [Chlamydomonas sp. UWO 241]|nr:hypothetical protein FOA52_005995 [Chlamydomonas sp. UWO 241]
MWALRFTYGGCCCGAQAGSAAQEQQQQQQQQQEQQATTQQQQQAKGQQQQQAAAAAAATIGAARGVSSTSTSASTNTSVSIDDAAVRALLSSTLPGGLSERDAASARALLQPLVSLAMAARHGKTACVHIVHLVLAALHCAAGEGGDAAAAVLAALHALAWPLTQFLGTFSSSGWVERLPHAQHLAATYTDLAAKLAHMRAAGGPDASPLGGQQRGAAAAAAAAAAASAAAGLAGGAGGRRAGGGVSGGASGGIGSNGGGASAGAAGGASGASPIGPRRVSASGGIGSNGGGVASGKRGGAGRDAGDGPHSVGGGSGASPSGGRRVSAGGGIGGNCGASSKRGGDPHSVGAACEAGVAELCRASALVRQFGGLAALTGVGPAPVQRQPRQPPQPPQPPRSGSSGEGLFLDAAPSEGGAPQARQTAFVTALSPLLSCPPGMGMADLTDEIYLELTLLGPKVHPGPHATLRHPLLRVWWWTFADGREELPWANAWELLEEALVSQAAAGGSATVQRLVSIVSDPASRAAIEAGIAATSAAFPPGFVTPALLDAAVHPARGLHEEFARLRALGDALLARSGGGRDGGGDGESLSAPLSLSPHDVAQVLRDQTSAEALPAPPTSRHCSAISVGGGGGGGAGGLATSLIGRDRELSVIHECLRSAAWARTGCVVMLAGQAGVGRGAVAGQAARSAAAAGLWTSVRTAHLGGARDTEDAARAVAACLPGAPGLGAADALGAWLAWHAPLLDGVGLVLRGVEPEMMAGPSGSGGGAGGAGGRAGGEADAPLWALLRLVMRAAPGLHVLVTTPAWWDAGARRPAAGGGPDVADAGDAGDAGADVDAAVGVRVVRVPIGPLGANDSVALLRSHVGRAAVDDDAAAAALAKVCAGLPSRLRLVGYALSAGIIPPPKPGDHTEAPATPPSPLDVELVSPRLSAPNPACGGGSGCATPLSAMLLVRVLEEAGGSGGSRGSGGRAASPVRSAGGGLMPGCHPQLVRHVVAVLERLEPGPASLLALLCLLPGPAADEQLSGPLLPAAGPHACQLALDMCALYDRGLLSFDALSRRHAVQPDVYAAVRTALLGSRATTAAGTGPGSGHGSGASTDVMPPLVQQQPGGGRGGAHMRWLAGCRAHTAVRMAALVTCLARVLDDASDAVASGRLPTALALLALSLGPHAECALVSAGQWLAAAASEMSFRFGKPPTASVHSYLTSAACHLNHTCALAMPGAQRSAYAAVVGRLASRELWKHASWAGGRSDVRDSLGTVEAHASPSIGSPAWQAAADVAVSAAAAAARTLTAAGRLGHAERLLDDASCGHQMRGGHAGMLELQLASAELAAAQEQREGEEGCSGGGDGAAANQLRQYVEDARGGGVAYAQAQLCLAELLLSGGDGDDSSSSRGHGHDSSRGGAVGATLGAEEAAQAATSAASALARAHGLGHVLHAESLCCASRCHARSGNGPAAVGFALRAQRLVYETHGHTACAGAASAALALSQGASACGAHGPAVALASHALQLLLRSYPAHHARVVEAALLLAGAAGAGADAMGGDPNPRIRDRAGSAAAAADEARSLAAAAGAGAATAGVTTAGGARATGAQRMAARLLELFPPCDAPGGLAQLCGGDDEHCGVEGLDDAPPSPPVRSGTGPLLDVTHGGVRSAGGSPEGDSWSLAAESPSAYSAYPLVLPHTHSTSPSTSTKRSQRGMPTPPSGGGVGSGMKTPRDPVGVAAMARGAGQAQAQARSPTTPSSARSSSGAMRTSGSLGSLNSVATGAWGAAVRHTLTAKSRAATLSATTLSSLPFAKRERAVSVIGVHVHDAMAALSAEDGGAMAHNPLFDLFDNTQTMPRADSPRAVVPDRLSLHIA